MRPLPRVDKVTVEFGEFPDFTQAIVTGVEILNTEHLAVSSPKQLPENAAPILRHIIGRIVAGEPTGHIEITDHSSIRSTVFKVPHSTNGKSSAVQARMLRGIWDAGYGVDEPRKPYKIAS